MHLYIFLGVAEAGPVPGLVVDLGHDLVRDHDQGPALDLVHEEAPNPRVVVRVAKEPTEKVDLGQNRPREITNLKASPNLRVEVVAGVVDVTGVENAVER